jgi:rfaE bifunctional protein kinase chain/domain
MENAVVNPSDIVGTLAAWLPRLRGKRVLIVGDVMLDHYIAGEVERISPEAPVPVVRVTNEWNVLGGAGNVAKSVAALGGAPVLLAVRGADHVGENLAASLDREGVEATLVEEPGRPTTIKTRIIAHNQQVVRVDREQDCPLSDPTVDALLAHIERQVRTCPVIILSDYGKGVISERLAAGLRDIVARQPVRPWVLVDPKPVNARCYEGVDLMTPNTKEASEVAGLPVREEREIIKAGLALFKRLKLRHLLITLGAKGMALFESPGRVWHVPTFAQKVFDVTGAGDTVISTIGLGLAAGMDLLSASLLANYAAGIVVGQVGTAAASPEEIARSIEDLPRPVITPWLDEPQ